MRIEESVNPGQILIDCLDCGAMFPVEDFRTGSFAGMVSEMYERSRRCPACEGKRKSEEERQAREAHRAELAARLPELLERSGAKRLWLVHHDPRSTDAQLLEREAQIGRTDVRFAREGDMLQL